MEKTVQKVMGSNATNVNTIFRFFHKKKDYDMCWWQTDIWVHNLPFWELDLKYSFRRMKLDWAKAHFYYECT